MILDENMAFRVFYSRKHFTRAQPVPPAGSLGSTTRKALRSDGAGATQGPAGERTATDEDTETARLGASKNPQKSPREGADSGSVLRG